MAKFEPKPFDYKTTNGGNRYENGDSVQAQTINDVVESAAYSQKKAEDSYERAISQGTSVKEGGQVQAIWDADKKLDKTEINLQFNQLWKSSQVETRIDVDGLDMGHDGEFAFCRGTNRYDVRPEVWRAGAISLNVNHKYYIDIVFNKNIGSVSGRINHENSVMPTFISNHDQVTYYLFIDPSIYVDVEYQINLIDLTEMFGAGNEPSSVAEVQKYIPDGTYYPYTKGKATKEELTELAGKVQKNTSAISKKLDSGFTTGTGYDEPMYFYNGYPQIIFIANNGYNLRMNQVGSGSLITGCKSMLVYHNGTGKFTIYAQQSNGSVVKEFNLDLNAGQIFVVSTSDLYMQLRLRG